MLMRTITNFTISVSLLLLCSHAGLAGEMTPLSIHDIVGTYQLDRIENPWLSEEVRVEINREINERYSTCIIGENYHTIGGFTTEAIFETRKIEGRAGERYVSETYQALSETMWVFMDIPRVFNSVIVRTNPRGPIVFVIEVFDYDSLVIFSSSSYLLYRRVK